MALASDERDPEEVWRRLPRATGLDPRERAVARELGAWRERTAERENRPVGAVLRDPTVVELAKRTPAGPQGAGADPRHQPGRRAPPRRRHPRRDPARPRRRADPARRGRPALHRAAGRAGDRARRGARAQPRAGGRARLRADRRARRPRPDRGRRAPRPGRARRAHAARLAPRASSAPSCSSCSAAGGGCRSGRAAGSPSTATESSRASTAVSELSENRPSTPSAKNCSYSANALPYAAGSAERAQLERQERVLVAERVRVHEQAGRVGVLDERRRRQRAAGRRRAGRCSPSTGRRRRRTARSPSGPAGVAMSPYVRGRRADEVVRPVAARRAAARAARRVSRSSAFRLPTSNDCTNTFAPRSSSPLRSSARTSGSSSGRPMPRKYVGCLVSG